MVDAREHEARRQQPPRAAWRALHQARSGLLRMRRLPRARSASGRSSADGCRDAEQLEHGRAPRRRGCRPVGAAPARAAGDDQRHGVQRVRRVGRAVRLEHVVGVAVVGGHHAHAAALVDGRDHLRRGSASTVSTAVTAAAITPVWPTMSALAKLMIPKRGASRQPRATRTRRPPRARSSAACSRRSGTSRGEGTSSRRSPGSGVLLAAVEEVRHVGVLLGLGHVQLRGAGVREHDRERRSPGARARTAPGSPSPPRSASSSCSARAAGCRRGPPSPGSSSPPSPKPGSASARVIWRILSGRKLKASTLSPGRIAGLPVDQRRLDELVRLAARRRRRGPPRLAAGGAGRARAVDEQVVGALGAVPAAVAVHRPVAPHDRADARAGDARRARAGSRRPACGSVSRPSVKACTTRSGTASSRASAISARRCSSEECTPPSETSPIRCTRSAPVNASRSTRVARPAMPSASASSMRTRSWRTTAPAPEVQVAHLAVAHLALGQPHGAPAGRQRRVRVALPQLVEDGGAGERDRVARTRLGEAPAVEHDQAGAGGGQRRAGRAGAHRAGRVRARDGGRRLGDRRERAAPRARRPPRARRRRPRAPAARARSRA